MNAPQREMPRYRCHKEVWALKIKHVSQSADDLDSGLWTLTFDDKDYAPIKVNHAWYMSHHPETGGFYVVYKDGYTSFSPKTAFEEGYTLIT